MSLHPAPHHHFDPSPPELVLYARRKAGVNASTDAASLSALAKLGVTRVRIGLSWANYLDSRLFAADRTTLDPVNGKTIAQWYAADRAAFAASGIDVLTDVNTPPSTMDLTSGIAQMPTFMASLASAFPGSAWEILNEMTSADVFNSSWFEASNPAVTSVTRGDWYGQVIGPVYDAVKAADPTATVVTGGIDRDRLDFYTGLVGRAPGKFDAFSVHAYGPPAYLNLESSTDDCKSFLGGTPLWITEFGSNLTSDAEQASDVGTCLAYIDKHCTTGDRYYIYRLIGDVPFDVVNADGTFRHAAMLLLDRPTL